MRKITFFTKKIQKEDMITNNDLKPGDLVKHEKYGNGVVLNIEGKIATISFTKNGVKIYEI